MRVRASFTGLLGTTTASHIHACTDPPGVGTAGVATQTPSFSGFPLGVTSGTYDHTFDMTLASSYNPAYVTAHGGTAAAAEAALATCLTAGGAYYNIHSNLYPAGEIRGFLLGVVSPTPAACVVPDVIGEKEGVATSAIATANCTKGKVTKQKPKKSKGKRRGKAKGSVVKAEDPAPGATVPAQTPVDLTIGPPRKHKHKHT
jgi:hypothetical protein